MTPQEAEKIINNYRRSIKDLRPNAIVQPISDLPYSAGMIKYAHFICGEYLIKGGLLTKKTGAQLRESYAEIDSIFVEDPELINTKYRESLKELNNGVVTKEIRLSHITESTIEREVEYNNFLADCQGNYKKLE